VPATSSQPAHSARARAASRGPSARMSSRCWRRNRACVINGTCAGSGSFARLHAPSRRAMGGDPERRVRGNGWPRRGGGGSVRAAARGARAPCRSGGGARPRTGAEAGPPGACESDTGGGAQGGVPRPAAPGGGLHPGLDFFAPQRGDDGPAPDQCPDEGRLSEPQAGKLRAGPELARPPRGPRRGAVRPRPEPRARRRVHSHGPRHSGTATAPRRAGTRRGPRGTGHMAGARIVRCEPGGPVVGHRGGGCPIGRSARVCRVACGLGCSLDACACGPLRSGLGRCSWARVDSASASTLARAARCAQDLVGAHTLVQLGLWSVRTRSSSSDLGRAWPSSDLGRAYALVGRTPWSSS